MTREQPTVALIATVLNEAESLPAWLASIDAQTRSPNEIVIVDGGSRDGTLELLKDWAGTHPTARVLSAPGTTISQGRNRAIAEASASVIAVTDAGVRLQPDWLERLVAGFGDGVDVVGGFFEPDPAPGVFEWAMGATVLPAAADVLPDAFLPSSRSIAFRREAWERVGGYPEWLDYCEDLVFDLGLKTQGYRLVWEPRAMVRFRPRGTLKAFFVQYYRYARGDGKADLWRLRHAVRYLAYAFAAYAIARPGTLTTLALALGAGLYCRRPAERLLASGSQSMTATMQALAWIPVIRLCGDVAKMVGYPVGVLWRWQHRPGGGRG